MDTQAIPTFKTPGLTAAEWAASPAGQRHDAVARFTETDRTPRRCLTGTARSRYLLQGHQYRRNRRLARQTRDHLPVPPDARPQPSRSPLRRLLDLQASRREIVVKLLDAARRTTNEQIAHWRRRSVQQNYLRPIPVEPHWALRLVDQRIETERQRVWMLAAADLLVRQVAA